MGAVGAWLGPQLTMIAFVTSGVIAVLCRGVDLGWKALRGSAVTPGDSPPAATSTTDATGHRNDATGHRNKMPYAVPVALAVWGLMGLKLLQVLGEQ